MAMLKQGLLSPLRRAQKSVWHIVSGPGLTEIVHALRRSLP